MVVHILMFQVWLFQVLSLLLMTNLLLLSLNLNFLNQWLNLLPNLLLLLLLNHCYQMKCSLKQRERNRLE